MRPEFSLRRFTGTGIIGAAFFIFLYAPIVLLVVLSFNSNRTATVWEGVSLKWYEALYRNEQIITAARHSLEIASVATLISVPLAVMGALALLREPRWMRQAMLVLNLPLVVPEIVVAIATLLFFAAIREAIGLDLGIGNVIIAHVTFCVPLAFLPVHARLQDFNLSLLEAAADLYARPWRRFWRITLPLLWPGVLSGATLAFVSSLDNVVITSFVAGAGSTTLPIYIFGSIRMGVTPEVNAISAVMLLISIVLVSLHYIVGRQADQQ